MLTQLHHKKNEFRLKAVLVHLMVIFQLIVLSCSNSKTNNSNFEYHLSKVDTISIFLPDTIPDINTARAWAYNQNYLSFLIKIDDITLYRYSFQEKMWDKICISCIEDTRIEFTGIFSFINDSIIMYNHSYKDELLLLNFNSRKLIEKYSYSPNYGLSTESPLNIYFDDTSYMIPILYNERIDDAYKSNANLAVIINKKTKHSRYIAPFPPSFKMKKNSSLKLIIPDMIINPSSLIMSFKGEEQLYIFSLKDSAYSTKLCKDKNVLNHHDYSTTEDYMNGALLEELTGMYKIFAYDKTDSLYYRISWAYPEYRGNKPSINKETYNILSQWELTVSVLDKNLEIIAQNSLNDVSIVNHMLRDGKLYLRQWISPENKINFIGFELVPINKESTN